MSRPKKDGKVLNIRIQSNIYTALEQYSNDKGQTKTLAVERILEQHLKKEGYMPNKLDSSNKH